MIVTRHETTASVPNAALQDHAQGGTSVDGCFLQQEPLPRKASSGGKGKSTRRGVRWVWFFGVVRESYENREMRTSFEVFEI